MSPPQHDDLIAANDNAGTAEAWPPTSFAPGSGTALTTLAAILGRRYAAKLVAANDNAAPPALNGALPSDSNSG